MVKVMVPSVPSEQVVGVVVILIMSSGWADRVPREVRRDRNSSMGNLYVFIRIQILAVIRQYQNRLILVANTLRIFRDCHKIIGSAYN